MYLSSYPSTYTTTAGIELSAAIRIDSATFPVMHQGAAAAYQKFVAGLASIVARKNNADRPADMDKHTARSHYLKQLLTVTCVDWLHGVDMPLVRAAMAQFMRTARGLDLQDRYGGHFSTLVAAKASRLMWRVRMQAMRDGYACIHI